MINIRTECRNCRHDEVCKYKEDWTKQANEWREAKNKETLVSKNIMVAILECRLYSPITYSKKSYSNKEEATCSKTSAKLSFRQDV